jgi:hypothetical protein
MRTYRTDEFSAEAPQALFSVAIRDVPHGGWALIQIEHRSGEDDAWAVAGAFSTLHDECDATTEARGLGKTIRYCVTIEGEPYVEHQPPRWLGGK